MGTGTFSDEFKRDAVHQITVRGYPVREVSWRLSVSSHSLYKWLRLFAEPVAKSSSIDHEAESRRPKRELARMTEERDILKKVSHGAPLVQEPWRTRTSRASLYEVPAHRGSSGRVRRPGHVPGSLQRILCMA